jgi:hypothetical protein
VAHAHAKFAERAERKLSAPAEFCAQPRLRTPCGSALKPALHRADALLGLRAIFIDKVVECTKRIVE